jgi:hypothetical protein
MVFSFSQARVAVRSRPCLIQGLACGSHDSDESLLLSVRGGGGGGDGGLLLVDGGEVGVAARHSR